MFSIIIHSSNVDEELNRSLCNLFKANTSNYPFELILLSTDDNSQIAAQYATQGFIRYIKTGMNLSFFNACNLAANKAKYPFLLFLKSNDVYPKNLFVHILEKKPASNRCILLNSYQDKGSKSHLQIYEKQLNEILFIKKSLNSDYLFDEFKYILLLCNKVDYIALGGFQAKHNKTISNQSKKNIVHNPAVSIIIPVHNTEKYLQQCIESVLSQSLKDIEVIIVNDGSSDNSISLIKKYMMLDDRIVLIENQLPSGNPGTPRNQALDIARGDYIGFVDSDDWIEPDMFEKMYQKARQEKSDIVFISGFHNHVGEKVEIRKYNNSFMTDASSPLYKYHQSFMIWDKIYKRSLLDKHNTRLGETKAAVDVPFIFKAYYYAQKVSFCEDYYGYHYRRESDNSITVNFRKNSDCDFEIRAYQYVYRWMDKENIEKWYRSIVDFRKVSSFIYTLNMASFEYFQDFYKHAQHEFNLIENNLIKFFAKLINNQSLYNNFNNIKKLPYFKYYIKKKSISDNSLEENDNNQSPSSKYCGNSSGIIYFPDWSHRNPYQGLLYTELNNQYDIKVFGYSSMLFNKAILKKHKHECNYVHIAWLHSFVDINDEDTIAKFLSYLSYALSIGYRIIWTSHNIVSHESKYVSKEIALRKFISEFCDYILVHGNFARDKLLQYSIAPDEKIFIVPHGSYVNFYPNTISANNARKKLDLNDKDFVFLFFGNIRDYKGIDVLLDYFDEISNTYSNAKLVIAGRIFDKEIESRINEFIVKNSNIIFHKDFIDPSLVQDYFKCADIVILPYKKILTSGVAILSLSFKKPVIAPRTGLLPEIISNNQGYLFNNHSELKSLMLKCLNLHKSGRWPDVSSSFSFEDKLKNLEWSKIVRQKPFSHIFGSVAHIAVDSIPEILQEQDTFVFYRILGNDLPHRHAQGQTYKNLLFTLENEKEFPNCRKIWILNRIKDQNQKKMLVDLMNKHDKQYLDIRFSKDEYLKADFYFDDLPVSNFKLTSEYEQYPLRNKLMVETSILKKRNLYLMNNNGARNYALKHGKNLAKWILPWDGNSFITLDAWNLIAADISSFPECKYFIVPMARVLNNKNLLDPTCAPEAREEPQIVFRRDAREYFNNEIPYGSRPKVDLLKRLGVPGVWDKSNFIYPWREHNFILSKESNKFQWAGWVARLSSGHNDSEQNAEVRALNREKVIIDQIKKLDKSLLNQIYDKKHLAYYTETYLKTIKKNFLSGHGHARKYTEILMGYAEEFLSSPLYSVTTKTTLPPSKDIHDYWHPAPYAWPNPDTQDGLPYIYRDGERVPGTRLYEKESAKYDRTSLQQLFDQTTVLALAWYLTGQDKYIKKAYEQIRSWFINTDTRMNPHLKYSQVVMGKNNNMGTNSGLIETKDFYFFLDAVRLVKRSSFWKKEDSQAMDSWCAEFLKWLKTSDAGHKELVSKNNHGVAYDLQTYSLAAFLGNIDIMYETLINAVSRLKSHFEKDGRQPHELKRTTTAHYTAFNLQLWLNLAYILRNTINYNIWLYQCNYDNKSANPLKLGLNWLLPYYTNRWPHKQIKKFEKERLTILYHLSKKDCPFLKKFNDIFPKTSDCKPYFFPHDGIPVFWLFNIDL